MAIDVKTTDKSILIQQLEAEFTEEGMSLTLVINDDDLGLEAVLQKHNLCMLSDIIDEGLAK